VRHKKEGATWIGTNTPHHNRFTALFPGPSGEPVPKENFWTLWCKGRLTEADILTGYHSIRTNQCLSPPAENSESWYTYKELQGESFRLEAATLKLQALTEVTVQLVSIVGVLCTTTSV